MAEYTATSNVTSVSIKPGSNLISSKTASATISWSTPTDLPNLSEITIISCILSGNTTCGGSAISAATINGVSITPASSSTDVKAFSINLGTDPTITSTEATATNKAGFTANTLVFQDMVFTVTYSMTTEYTVTFLDWDGSVLETQTVGKGQSAITPVNPYRYSYIFTGWDKDFTNITGDLTVTALYRTAARYVVNFYDHDNTLLKTENVYELDAATAPANPNNKYGYEFVEWSDNFSSVTRNLDIYAYYKKIENPHKTIIFKPVSYQNDSENGWTKNFEAPYDNDTTTAVKAEKINQTIKYITYYWDPIEIDFNIYKPIKYTLKTQACCKNSGATGPAFLYSTLLGTGREFDMMHLQHHLDWYVYEHDINYEEFLALRSGVKYGIKCPYKLSNLGDIFGLHAYIYDLYVEIEYIDLSENLELDISQVYLEVGESVTVTATTYPIDTNIIWSNYNNNGVVYFEPSADGKTCKITAINEGSCIATAMQENNTSINNTIAIDAYKPNIEAVSSSIKVGNSTINSALLQATNISKIYLGDQLLLSTNKTVPCTGFKYNNLKTTVIMPLYERIIDEAGYTEGILCRQYNYCDLKDGINVTSMGAGHMYGGIKNTDDAASKTKTNLSLIKVIPGEKLIMDYPTTKYSFGLMGYGADKKGVLTYYGPGYEWHHYSWRDNGDDADIEGPHNETIIPSEVHYIRWCYAFSKYNQDMDAIVYLRRLSYREIDIEPMPPNTTEIHEFSYASSNTNIAVIENGNIIRAVAAGECTITVTYGSQTVNIRLIIYDNSSQFPTYAK